MTEGQITLAKRAVACKGWRWMGGMLRVSPVLEKAYFDFHPDVMPTERVLDRHPSTDADKIWSNATNAWVQMLPDLTDPATLGCLLALVREARGEPTYLPTCLDVHDEAWVINPPIPWRQTRHGSYAAVLVAALEAAP